MADNTTLKGLRFFTTYFFKTSDVSFVMLSFIDLFFMSGANNQPSKVLQIFVLIKFFYLFAIVCMNGVFLPPELSSKQKKP